MQPETVYPFFVCSFIRITKDIHGISYKKTFVLLILKRQKALVRNFAESVVCSYTQIMRSMLVKSFKYHLDITQIYITKFKLPTIVYSSVVLIICMLFFSYIHNMARNQWSLVIFCNYKFCFDDHDFKCGQIFESCPFYFRCHWHLTGCF